MTNAETQLASYFAKYEPAIVKLGKALRVKLRVREEIAPRAEFALDLVRGVVSLRA